MRLLSTADCRLAIEAIEQYLPISKAHGKPTNEQLTALLTRLKEGITAETDERQEAFRAGASRQYSAQIEVDEGAIVSEGDDDGAYVQCWIWVTCEEAGLPSKVEEEETDEPAP